MHSDARKAAEYHDVHVGARRQLYPTARLSDRLGEPSILLTALFVLVALIYNFRDHPAVGYFALRLWDVWVFLTPAHLIQTIEDWRFPRLAPRPMQDRIDTHAAKSQAMRRIVSFPSSGGMIASAFPGRARALSVSGMLGFKTDLQAPPGLGNRDNSCFQNSVLQGLASLPTLPNYLATCAQLSEVEEEDKAVAQTLRTLMADLTDGTQNGRTIWTPNKLRFMSTWTQQDAQEYYSKVLDDIDKCVAKAVGARKKSPGFESSATRDSSTASQHSDDSGYHSGSTHSRSTDQNPTRNPLEGLLAQRVACVQCGYSEGLSMIPFNCLTLSLGLDSGQHDLYERMDAYSRVEAIEGVECTKCTLLRCQTLLTGVISSLKTREGAEEQLAEFEQRLQATEEALGDDDFQDETIKEKCKISEKQRVTTTKTKQVVIARPPQSLVVHMNRSVFDPSTFHMMKNSAPVSFPMTLDLGPWCLGSRNSTTVPLKGQGAGAFRSGEDEERWATDPKSSMIAGDQDTSRVSGPIYELRAIVTHAGRHENGHYVCYRKHPSAVAAADTDDARAFHSPGEVKDPATEAERETEGAASKESSGDSCWWRLSDEAVMKVEEDYVLAQAPGVFMLFYDCVDPSMVPNEEPPPGGEPVEAEPESEPEAATPTQQAGFFDTAESLSSALATPELTDEDSGVETTGEASMPATPVMELEKQETVRDLNEA